MTCFDYLNLFVGWFSLWSSFVLEDEGFRESFDTPSIKLFKLNTKVGFSDFRVICAGKV
jgi:hypothetical protein